jgi:hypothetical protein
MKIASNALAQRRDYYNKERGDWLKHWALMSTKERPIKKPQRLDAALRKQHANN